LTIDSHIMTFFFGVVMEMIRFTTSMKQSTPVAYYLLFFLVYFFSPVSLYVSASAAQSLRADVVQFIYIHRVHSFGDEASLPISGLGQRTEGLLEYWFGSGEGSGAACFREMEL